MSSGTVAVWAMKDNDYEPTEFAGTTAGLQAAIDYLEGGKGKVFIGPGELQITTVISLHTNCHIQGSGVGVTVIKRATGSLLSGDPAASGNTFINTGFGANGTLRTTVGDSEISISDMTLDGNHSAFGAVTIGSNNHIGIRLHFVDGIRLQNLRIQNYLQSGVEMNECRNTFSDNLYIYTVGQYASATSRNGLDFLNNAASESAYSRDHQISNVTVDTCTDASFHFKNNQNLAYKNLVIKNGGKYGFEIECATVGTQSNSDVTISNVVADGLTQYFLVATTGTECQYQRFLVQNCTCVFGATHGDNAVNLARSSTNRIESFIMRGCTFNNINQSDVANKAFFVISSTTSGECKDIHLSDCIFEGGAPSSTNTGSHGIQIDGTVNGFSVRNCVVKDAPGIGIFVRPTGGKTIQRGLVHGNTVLNSGNTGIAITCNSGSGNTVKDIIVANNFVMDSAETTGTDAIVVGTEAAGNTTSNVIVMGNHGRKVSSANMVTGVVVKSTGTTDDITIIGNDMVNLTNPVTTSNGTPTGGHFTHPSGRGSDITAAATIGIPRDGSVFHVTGNTNITNGITVNGLDNGRTVTLIFEGTPTVSDTGTSKLAGNFVAAGTTNDFDTLTLVCDGTNWTEVARSTN